MGEPGNGNTLRYRVEQLEKRQETYDEGARWLSRAGERHNEQIKAHDRRLEDIEEKAMKVPILEERIDTLADGYKSARTAFYAAAVALFGLIATILLQGSA